MAKPVLFAQNTQEETEKAEILWVMNMFTENWSFASCDGVTNLFKRMFPETVSSYFSLARNEASSMISNGLGPYFKKLVEDLNTSQAYFTLHFNETTTQQGKN